MKMSDYLPWFKALLGDFQKIAKRQLENYIVPTFVYDSAGAQGWVAEAGSALTAVFPPSHHCSKEWSRLCPGMQPNNSHGGTLEQLLGVFQAATKQLQEGRLGSLIDGIRAETENELLDQASILLEAKHLAAATVISGGALESHLKHLVTKNNLPVDGAGSIERYNTAISRARNDGTIEVYSTTDTKQVTAWGGMRNDAAHAPMAFSRTQTEVQLMIELIRQFIQRVS